LIESRFNPPGYMQLSSSHLPWCLSLRLHANEKTGIARAHSRDLPCIRRQAAFGALIR
jgi:hypothetical protein